MTLRLIVALLALFLSLTTTAAPACRGVPAAAAGHAQHRPAGHDPAKHGPARYDIAAAHVCVGCAPLGDWLRAPLAAPLAPRAPMPTASVAALDVGDGIPPALPPPRPA